MDEVLHRTIHVTFNMEGEEPELDPGDADKVDVECGECGFKDVYYIKDDES